MHTALSIAGSDCSGGAGIQADIKTMSAHGVYAMSAITALTAQNTSGVTDIMDVEPGFLSHQLDSIFTDIFPDAIKIGMLSNEKIMQAVAEKLIQYQARHIVLDPVMVATSGAVLMQKDAQNFLIKNLAPLAEIITPNIPEAQEISGMSIQNDKDMLAVAEFLYHKISAMKEGCKMPSQDTAILIKGGHSAQNANDLLFSSKGAKILPAPRIHNSNMHGTGCTLSSAIACNLAKGYDIQQAAQRAKDYVTGALKSGLKLGHGFGPINHLWASQA